MQFKNEVVFLPNDFLAPFSFSTNSVKVGCSVWQVAQDGYTFAVDYLFGGETMSSLSFYRIMGLINSLRCLHWKGKTAFSCGLNRIPFGWHFRRMTLSGIVRQLHKLDWTDEVNFFNLFFVIKIKLCIIFPL